MSEPKAPNKPKSGGGRGAVEVTARTVDEAIARGLVRLGGLSRSEVEIEVLREGRAGLLGFGAEDAQVRLTPLGPGVAPSTPAAPAAPVREARTEPRAKAAPEPAKIVDEEGGDERRGRRRRRGRGEGEAAAVTATPAEAVAPERAPAEPMTPVAPAPSRADAAVTAQPTEGADAASAAEVALELVRLMGYDDATIEVEDSLLPDGEDDDVGSAVLCIRGQGTDRLLQDDSAPLNALQFVTRLIVSRRADTWCSVLLDVDGDRRRRVRELLALANQSAELVESGGKPVSLPPMGAYERRVVHLALRAHPTVATQSIGTGGYRKVTVRRRDQMLPEY